MAAFWTLFALNYLLGLIVIIDMLMRNRKKPERIYAWILTLVILPFIGLTIYAIIGCGIGFRTNKQMKERSLSNKTYDEALRKQATELLLHENKNLSKQYGYVRDLALFNLKNTNAIYSFNNNVEILINGPDTLERIKEDLINAKDHIHMLYYIFANDETGREIRDILIAKALEGVKVKVLYDAIGSKTTELSFFKKLIIAGGEVQQFFPSIFGFKYFNPRLNNRNHRKIIVIDGIIGYTGGINIRDDHMNKSKKLRPWRDTHLRIEGSSVHSLQSTFLSDWCFSSKDKVQANHYMTTRYFPVYSTFANNFVQIVASGPDSTSDAIKEGMIKMMLSAKKRVRIQTPYFVPDETFMGVIKTVITSGVEVEIMIPSLPDRKYVQNATLCFVNDAIKMGAKVYCYQGFIHAKTMIVDDNIFTIGTCNIDARSFKLNFEVNAFICGNTKTTQMNNIFEKDVLNCYVLDKNFMNEFSFFKRLSMSLCRLFSSLL